MGSCSRAIQFEQRLNDIESIVAENPDSAITLLNAMDITEPRHIERKSKLALLHIMAHDRTNDTNLDETLIKLFSSYFFKSNNAKEQFYSHYYTGRVHLLNNDTIKAISSFSKAEQYSHVVDNWYQVELSKYIDSICSLNDYLKQHHKDFKAELNTFNQTIEQDKECNNTNIFVLIAISCTIIILLYEILNKREKKIYEYNLLIEELKHLHNNNESERLSSIIKSLLKDQYKILNSLGSSMYGKENNPTHQKILFKEVQIIIEKFKQKKVQDEIENLINNLYGNIMTKIKMEFSDISDENYTLICYHIAGFSSKMIGLILGISEQNVNVRKHRLFKQIVQSELLITEKLQPILALK